MDGSTWGAIVIAAPIEIILIIMLIAKYFIQIRPKKKTREEIDRFYYLHPTYNVKDGIYQSKFRDDYEIGYVMFHGYKCGYGTVFKAQWENYLAAENYMVTRAFIDNELKDYVKQNHGVYLRLEEATNDWFYKLEMVKPTEDGRFVPVITETLKRGGIKDYSEFRGIIYTQIPPDILMESADPWVIPDEEACERKRKKRLREALGMLGKQSVKTYTNISFSKFPLGVGTFFYVFAMAIFNDSIGGMIFISLIYVWYIFEIFFRFG